MRDFPSVILNTPKTKPYLNKLFGYESDYYDLDAYEKIHQGFGKLIWEMFLSEIEHQEYVTQRLLDREERLRKPWYYFDWLWPI